MVLPARDRNLTYQGMTAQDVFDCVYVIFAHDFISSRQNYILKKKFDGHDWEIQVIVVALVHKDNSKSRCCLDIRYSTIIKLY